ncbi:unnamed protein product [Prunus armeniaca]
MMLCTKKIRKYGNGTEKWRRREENEPRVVVRMRGIEVREGHVDAAQPHLPEPGIEVKNHTNINWGGLRVLCLGQESRPKQFCFATDGIE